MTEKLDQFRPALFPAACLMLLLLAAFGANLIAQHDPVEMDISNRLTPPSATHWLGQDEFGRDIFSRLLHGARVSLTVALLSATISMFIGVTLGVIGGYFRGISEFFTLRLVDIVLSFPPILLALLIVTLYGPGATTLTVCLSILFAPGFARVAYGETISVRERDFIEASRALGMTPARIIISSVLPNIAPPLLVQYSLTVASAVLIESGLSFLGLGVVPPDPSWGLMIRSARGYMSYSSLGLVWPCLALVITVLIFNTLCDRLRDIYDPKIKLSNAAPDKLPPSDMPALRADALLQVDHLSTHIQTEKGTVQSVVDVSFYLRQGETLAIVGESGSGKSITGLSLMGLVPEPGGRVVGGQVLFRSRDASVINLADADEVTLQAVRGGEIAMVFQEPMTALNPVYRIGDQITEAIRQHSDISAGEARERAINALERVGIPEPAMRLRAYPHELSGGLRQRAMIAMTLAMNPRLLIADEPTTALDVTIQAQILDLLRRLMKDNEERPGMIFVTHDLGVVSELADRVAVFYAGRLVEEGTTQEIFTTPRHPYTRGLLDSAPVAGSRKRLKSIRGTVPSAFDMPSGCAFAPRCDYASDQCRVEQPDQMEISPGHRSRCWNWTELT